MQAMLTARTGSAKLCKRYVFNVERDTSCSVYGHLVLSATGTPGSMLTQLWTGNDYCIKDIHALKNRSYEAGSKRDKFL